MAAKNRPARSLRPPAAIRRGLALGAACAMLIALPTIPALAHETREVGDIVMTVGWGNEPVYAGYQHPVEVFLSGPPEKGEEEGPPISDAEITVEVFFGPEPSGTSSGVRPMDEAFGEPGHFEADMIPTRPGTYTFHFTGTVAGQAIDEVFTSGPDTFSDANLAAAIQFPAKDPTTGELAERVERLDARVADAGGSPVGTWIAIGSALLALAALVVATRRRSTTG